jgi:hypothetical protein
MGSIALCTLKKSLQSRRVEDLVGTVKAYEL